MNTPTLGSQYTRTQTFTVTAVDDTNSEVTLTDEDGKSLTKRFAFLNQLQYVQPPVTIFEAGQTVRRMTDGALFSIVAGGYFEHATGQLVRSSTLFTSTSFEAVTFS